MWPTENKPRIGAVAPYGFRGNEYGITMTMDAEESSQYPNGFEYPLEDPEDVRASGD